MIIKKLIYCKIIQLFDKNWYFSFIYAMFIKTLILLIASMKFNILFFKYIALYFIFLYVEYLDNQKFIFINYKKIFIFNN